jgi:hypothetical protein
MKKQVSVEEYTQIQAEGRVVAVARVEDVGNKNYFKMEIVFPSGHKRELYVSWKVLEGTFGLVEEEGKGA